MGPICNYSPGEMQEAKSRLFTIKPGQITDLDRFHTQFLCIWNTLASHHAIDRDTVLTLDTLAICLNRALALAKQNSAYICYYEDSSLLDIFHYICEYHQHGSGAYTNALGGLLTKLLQLMNYVSSHASTQLNESMLARLKVHVMSMQPNQKSFYVIAEAALKNINGFAQSLHVSNTRFPKQCLEIMWSGALANSASKTFGAYYSQLHDPRKDPATYIQSWSVSVEEKLGDQTLRRNIIDHLLPHLFKTIPNHFSDWAKKLHFQSMSSSWQELLLDISKKGSQISPSSDPILKGLMDSEQLWALLHSPDEKTRLDAFSLAANAINASKGCPEYALEIIQDLELLGSIFKESTTPESRSAFMSVFRKALLNMKDFVTTMDSRLKKRPCAEDQTTVLKYISALQSIFFFVKAQIIPDSSYAQIVTSIAIIKLFTEHEFDGIPRQKKSKNLVKIFDIYTPTFTNVLLRFTANNYDDIRSSASSILGDCPYEMFNQAINNDGLQQTLAVLQSFKGRVSDSVAQLMITVFSMQQENDEERCVALLQMIMQAMESVMKSEPLQMHGYFTVWAGILPITILTEQKKQLFKYVIDMLLKSITVIWNTVKPQMKLSESTIAEASDTKYWRVIKESAILLKSIMSFNTKHEWAFFDSTFMPNICQLLIDQLTTMTHRGAFASISTSFVTACEICFKTESLSTYPDTIVAQNLDLLTSHKQLITRRSAGIPFVFCEVINAASRYNNAKLEQLSNQVFSKLYEIATSDFESSGNETHDIPQVHALNCIRQLFKESGLEDGTRKHTNQALRLSLTYLNNQTWSVKNSSLMLFTALNEKLFGSHKLGDTLPSVNASLFFSRYSGISEILLTMLKGSDRENVNNIVPVLAIVSRLKVNTENDSTLDPFIDLLKEQFLCHRVWKVREMSARSIANMVHKTSYSSELTKSLENSGKFAKNKQHGCLLYAMELIEQARSSKTELEDYTNLAAKRFHEACTSRHDSDLVIQRACLQVMMTKTILQKDAEKINDHVASILNTQQPQPNGALSLFLNTATTAVLRSISEEKLLDMSKTFISSHRYEVQVATSKYFLEHHDQFARFKELHPYLLKEIMAGKSDYVTGLYLDLALISDIKTAQVFEKPKSVSEKEGLKYELLALRSNQSPHLMIVSHDPQASVDVKLLRARVINELMSSNKSEEEEEEVSLILHRFKGLSDDSHEVRVVSCFPGMSTRNSKKRLLERARSLGKKTVPYFTEEITRSVMQNIRDFESEQVNPENDLERTNTFVHEIQDTQDLLGVIESSDAKALTKSDLISCVEAVLQIAKENVSTLQSYVFNVHLDTAIRKVLVIAGAYEEDEKLVKVKQEFGAIFQATNYPLRKN